MYTCNKIKQQLNAALISGKKELQLDRKDITDEEIMDLEECGYIVEEKEHQIIIKE